MSESKNTEKIDEMAGKKEAPFRLHANQRLIFDDKHRFRVVNCGRRFGKTMLAMQELLTYCFNRSGDIRVAYIGPTRQQAEDIAWREMKKFFAPFTQQVHEAKLQIICNTCDVKIEGEQGEFIPNGGTMTAYIYSWEAIDRVRGMFFDFIVVDEVAQMDEFWVSWRETLLPTLTDRRGKVLFLSTPVGFNHFYDLYQEELNNVDFKSFKFTSYDNPTLPEGEIDTIKTYSTEDSFAQEYLADFRKRQGLVYPEFKREHHVVKEAPAEFSEIICGVDFGYTAPACVLKIGIDKDSHFWVLDEWYKTGQTGMQIAEVAAHYRPNMVYGDPAEPDKIQDLKNAGLYVRETNKDIIHGVDRVREMFKQNRVHILGHCQNLIAELESYHYADPKPDRNQSERPVKSNDHAIDALRYAIYSHTPTEYGIEFTNINKKFI
jgi:phage terminase large subunit